VLNKTREEAGDSRMAPEAMSRSGWRSSRPSFRLRDSLTVAWDRHVYGWKLLVSIFGGGISTLWDVTDSSSELGCEADGRLYME
jgi:hypothetical protein